MRIAGLFLPAIFDAPFSGKGPFGLDLKAGAIVPVPLQEICVVKALAEENGAGFRLFADHIPNEHSGSSGRYPDDECYFRYNGD